MRIRFSKKKCIAVVLLLALVTIALNGVCLGGDDHAAPAKAAGATCHADSGADVPCCPDHGHPEGGHCDSCLSCPCHAPLTVDALQLGYAPSITALSFFERCTPPAEVYLSKFVPPQNLA